MLRYVGYSAGSALSATLLVGTVPAGGGLPTEAGYSAAAWAGIGTLVLAQLVATVLGRRPRVVVG